MNPKAIHGSQWIPKPKSTWAECTVKVVLGATFRFSHSTMTTLHGKNQLGQTSLFRGPDDTVLICVGIVVDLISKLRLATTCFR